MFGRGSNLIYPLVGALLYPYGRRPYYRRRYPYYYGRRYPRPCPYCQYPYYGGGSGYGYNSGGRYY